MEQDHEEGMKGPFWLKMIYNNTGSEPGLKAAWGLSVWIDQEDQVILFDTGGDADLLLQNLEYARLDPARISRIVISHDHWDHKNGLKGLLKNPACQADVLVPEKVRELYSSDWPVSRIRGISGPEEISPGIWSTGSIETMYNGSSLYEQALVLVRGNNLYLLTGCSHPGIGWIVQRVNQLFPEKRMVLVAGGFHLGSHTEAEVTLISETFRREGVDKIAPSHCTGEAAIALFRNEWGDYFTEFNLGDELILQ